MARKNTISYPIKPQPPTTLDDNPFYGIQCDEYQKQFRDAIWNPEKLIVFCNAKAGTGKQRLPPRLQTCSVNMGFMMESSISLPRHKSKSRVILQDLSKRSQSHILSHFMRLYKRLALI